ncbi:MAG TPA: Ku protein [Burkholderiaceae bacterium]|nr:Ku protein [Burkholderiaceae bacterium]
MARALWKGAISFGLVHIPVELHAAARRDELDLTMLDRRDFAPVGYRRYNKHSGEEVTWDNIIKGYEYEDGDYVVLSDEDLRRANVAATQTIEILCFVGAGEIPPTYYEQPYYLAPVRGGARVYSLLRETLRKSGMVGVATVVMRTRQHMCALLCLDDAIVLNTLRYATEVLDAGDLALPSAHAGEFKPKELDMALELVEGMAAPWRPQQYHDSYRDDLMALVDQKVKAGKTHTITRPSHAEREPGADNVIDLVELLQRSLRGKDGASHKTGGTAGTGDGRKTRSAASTDHAGKTSGTAVTANKARKSDTAVKAGGSHKTKRPRGTGTARKTAGASGTTRA